MSMSQEEIEALMNGLDTEETPPQDDIQEEPVQESTEEESSSQDEVMSEDDIENLIAQTQITSDESQGDDEEIVSEDMVPTVEEPVVEDETPIVEEESETQEENIDDMLADIDGIIDSEAVQESESVDDIDHEEIGRNWTDKQIGEGVFPLPVEKNTKVVEQLSQVANDSEEKATKIFDVLSFIMDENIIVQNNANALEDFVQKQTVLLDTLSKKFPNIEIFKENLEAAHSLKGKGSEIMTKVDSENTQLFEAMELMQFHDINRQKIERVMSVIRKLSDYLNGIFEDNNEHQEVAVAKHIHGDSNDDLMGDDDLDALIAEFGN